LPMDKTGVEKNFIRFMNVYFLPILYAAVIFGLSSRSFESVHLYHGMDKGVHLILYAGFGYTVLRAFRKVGGVRFPVLWAVLIVTVYGITDEFHQSFVPGRDFELLDMVFDGLGGLLAAAFCRTAERFGWSIWF